MHRFSWAIDLISEEKNSKNTDWIESEIFYWYNKYSSEITSNNTKFLRWEPYTVSEEFQISIYFIDP